ncbi:MAG: Type secretion system hydrolase TadA/VirB11/CpaF, TadA subfamily protein, partial [Labilithrix sp.]|nr:Type secretion system hydrolase TadA/VirB11/CpaF, TadA subfamily protein [Labilithrix sp.]
MHLQVVVQSDDGMQRTELYPANGPLTIGRHPQCSLRLDSDLVSRQHAVIQAGHGTLRVEDVSTNGTIAGDLLLRRDSVEVPYGTPIVVGDFTVFVYPAEQQNAAALAAQHPRHPQAPLGPPGATGQHPVHDTRQRMPSGGQQNATVPPGAQNSPANGVNGMLARSGSGPYGTSGAVPVVTGMNPVIAHVGAQPGSGGVHLPAMRNDEAKHKAEVDLRREIHKLLLEHLDLATIDAKKLDDPSMRPKVLNALRRIVASLESRIPREVQPDTLIGELADEALGLGPLERFLADPTITEIMVVDPNTIYIEQHGKITLSHARFTDDERVRAVIERIVTPLGRRIDESSPLVDARLKDGSRVNAVIRPIALRGSCITIRKFAKIPLTLEKIVSFGTMTERMGRFLTRCVHAKKNIVISGGTGSGKTTLLNVLSGAIPAEERIVTIEDAAELQLKQPHVVSMETRPANLEGRGEYTIRDLVKNALRMRPDRIVVGECRGGEALDMLQAMNTGHDGSLSTTHANSPREAVSRLETLGLMAGLELPMRAIREHIA